ncbi:MAG TPA: HepT-like ribonuclease domain-containing protein [Thermodesulfovibrionales bacterium]|nr:HepT-like ribonuclease domain-containing protein [Thermodesulfovibrionales bacterium]
MRDKITHFYFGINYKVVWSVVKKELPAIEPAIAKILSDLKASGKKK